MAEKQRIFVAENEALLAKLMKKALELEGRCQVELFSDGLELYQSVQSDPPDLIIVDMLMPSLSGVAISRLLKFHRDLRKIPVIVVSGITDSGIREQILGAGADQFIPKPFEIEELCTMARQLLSLSG